MAIIKGRARILAPGDGEVLGEGMCYLQTLSPERNNGTLSRITWPDPAPTLTETDTYRLVFEDDGRSLPIQFTRLGATACGPEIARFRGVGRLSDA